METLVLLPKGDIYDRPHVRVLGRTGGLDDLVTVNGRFIVSKVAGGTYYSGVGQRRPYGRTHFEVWQAEDANFRWDKTTQQEVRAKRCVVFDKMS